MNGWIDELTMEVLVARLAVSASANRKPGPGGIAPRTLAAVIGDDSTRSRSANNRATFSRQY